MKNEQIIKDFYGKIIGKIITKPNGDKEVRDFYNKILGRYDSRMDVTKDFYGKIIAKGEVLSMLLNQK